MDTAVITNKKSLEANEQLSVAASVVEKEKLTYKCHSSSQTNAIIMGLGCPDVSYNNRLSKAAHTSGRCSVYSRT